MCLALRTGQSEQSIPADSCRPGFFHEVKRMMIRGFPGILLLGVLTACSNVQTLRGEVVQIYNQGLALTSGAGIVADHSVDRSAHWVLSQDVSFYVALSGLEQFPVLRPTAPGDLPLTQPVPDDSLSAILAGEVRRQFPRVLRAERTETLFDARQSAARNRIDFVIYPRILLWEDTIGTWTELVDTLRYRERNEIQEAFGLDRARIQLTVLDTTSGRIVDVVAIQTRAGVLGLYEETPDRLLVAALGRYVDSLIP